MTRRTVIATVTVTVLVIVGVIVLSANPGRTRTSLDLGAAKAIARFHQVALTEAVPPDLVAQSEDDGLGYLGRCSVGSYSWNSVAYVVFSRDVGEEEVERLLDTLQAPYMFQERWTVVRDRPTAVVTPDLSLYGPEGLYATISTVSGGTQLSIDVSSPCFELDEGLDPHGYY